MKKNILILLPLIYAASAFSMENLMESMIFTPKEVGLGLYRSLSDYKWEKDNLYSDVEKKQYDPTNLVYSDKYDRTMVAFANENDPRLVSLIDLSVAHYPEHQIKPGNGTALVAYNRLIEEKKAKQLSLKKIIKANDQKHIEELNTLIIALQKSVIDQIDVITTNLKTHLEKRNNVVETNCAEIRKFENAIANLYQLNRQFKLPDNQIKVQATISQDQTILQDIKVDESMYATKDNTEKTIAKLNEANSLLQIVQALRY